MISFSDYLKVKLYFQISLALLVLIIQLMIPSLPSVVGLGFDGGSACSPKASRRGRAQLIATIPCNLNEQTYCNQPGALYPWHAVRRFVHENQGLMKRMYGDVKHISVLRTEIDNNEIEVDDVEQAAARYSRSGWKKNKYLYTDFQNSKSNDVLTEPYFRPTTSSTTKPPSASTPYASPTNAMATAYQNTSTSSATTRPSASATFDSLDTNSTVQHIATTINAVFEKITLPSMMPSEPHVAQSAVRPLRNKTQSTAATISTTLRIFEPPKVSEASSITPPQDDDNDGTDDAELGATESLGVVASTTEAALEDQNNEVRNELGDSDANVFEKEQDQDDNVTPQTVGDAIGNQFTAAKQANRNTVRPSSLAVEPLPVSPLFQDAVHKDQQGPVVPPLNARGV